MIGIIGGTFDPIHFGHLRPALEIAEQLSLEEVRFIPSAQPPHRWQPEASAGQRLDMVKLGIEGTDKFIIDDREYQRDGASYTVDTVASLRSEMGDQKPICMIIGADAFQSFTSWHNWQKILDFTHLVVSSRPGYTLEDGTLSHDLQKWIQEHQVDSIQELQKRAAGKLFFCDVIQLDISATYIRKQLLKGESASYLTPQKVTDYIKQHKLYT